MKSRNNTDWEGLKNKKEAELPSAKLKAESVASKKAAKLEKKINKIEKALFSACKSQEAGTTKLYYLSDQVPASAMVLQLLPCFSRDYLGSYKTWREVEQVIKKRLTDSGIKCDDNPYCYGWSITLP